MMIRVVAARPHSVELSPGATVFEIKKRIFLLEAIPLADQRITFDGHQLDENEATLASCGVEEGCTLNVDMSLLGGKVHGSLARAGKVKGQTPKVAKAEKKKKKTGRAKRRFQYNKRFKTAVVQVGGRKRGPNAPPLGNKSSTL